MIRIGPARQSNAGPIAAALSCAGCVCCSFGAFLSLVGVINIAMANNGSFDDPFFDDVNRSV